MSGLNHPLRLQTGQMVKSGCKCWTGYNSNKKRIIIESRRLRSDRRRTQTEMCNRRLELCCVPRRDGMPFRVHISKRIRDLLLGGFGVLEKLLFQRFVHNAIFLPLKKRKTILNRVRRF